MKLLGSPLSRSEQGFLGALNLEDRESGHGMMIQVWETEEQAKRMPDSAEFQKALAAIMAVSTGERAPIKVWRVNAFVGPGPVLRETLSTTERAGQLSSRPAQGRGRLLLVFGAS